MNFYYISLNLHKFDTLIKFYLKVNNFDDFYLSFVFMCAFYRFLAVVSMYMYCIYIEIRPFLMHGKSLFFNNFKV